MVALQGGNTMNITLLNLYEPQRYARLMLPFVLTDSLSNLSELCTRSTARAISFFFKFEMGEGRRFHN